MNLISMFVDMELWFLKIRIKAIRGAREDIQNESSGPRLEKALENREMNRNWFFRNVDKLEKKLTSQEFNQLKIDLDLE